MGPCEALPAGRVGWRTKSQPISVQDTMASRGARALCAYPSHQGVTGVGHPLVGALFHVGADRVSAQDKEGAESGEGRTRRFAPPDLRQATHIREAGYAYSGGKLGASVRQARQSGE